MAELLRSFSLSQRFIILIALAGAVSVMVAVALWTQQPDMQVLYAKLSPEDANTIIQKLDELKVPHELAMGGTTVLVPQSQVHGLRLKLAGEGMPSGGSVGFEIFDRSSIGMSNFVQKLNFRRALQGELARTLTQMAGVEHVRVHLAMPERRLFATDQEQPQASVVITLQGGHTLGARQIQGVVHLVASSVEGLQPMNVTVIDGFGNLLSGASEEGPGPLIGTQLEYQRSLEHDLEQRIQSMLERIVGMNKAVVRVSSVVSFRQVEHTEETFDPDSQVVRSEQRNQERSSEVNSQAGGIPGVASNVPPGESLEPAQNSSNTTQVQHETLNYEINRRVSRIVEPTGSLQHLSVAVLIDGTYQPGAGGGTSSGTAEGGADRAYSPRTPEEMQQFEELIKKAMGFSADRGDQLEVVNVPFESGTELGSSSEGGQQRSWAQALAPYVRYGVGSVLFLILLFFVVRPLISMLGSLPATGGGGGQEGPTLPAPLSQVETQLGVFPKTKVIEEARKDPQSTALVVKGWLKGNA